MNDIATFSRSTSLKQKTAKKLQLRWRSYGFGVLIVPALLLAVLTYQLWKQYQDSHHALDLAKSQQVEKITKISADILNQMIGEIQRRTDKAAETLSLMKLNRIDASVTQDLDAISSSLARLSIGCDVNTASNISSNGSQVTCAVLHEAEQADRLPLNSNQNNHYEAKVYGSALAFSPHTVEPQGAAPWSSYFYHLGNDLAHKNLNDIHYTDATDKSTEWFHLPVNSHTSVWVDPYKDDAGDTYMITYSSIIKNGVNGAVIGVVTVDISINQLETIIEKLMNGYDGFGALTYGNGLYVYHPERDFVKEGLTLQAVSIQKNDPDRQLVAELAAKGERITMSHTSTTTGEQSWMVVEPIKSSHWSLQNTFFKNSLYSEADFDRLRRLKILGLSSAILLISWLLAIIVNVIGWNVTSGWVLSAMVSAMLIAGIGQTWDLALNGTKPKNSGDDIVDSRQTIETIKNNYMLGLKKSDQNGDVVITVPTGIYIQSIDLKDANIANINGRVWQVHSGTCSKECKKNCEKSLHKATPTSDLNVDSENCTSCKLQCKKELEALANAGILFGRAKNMKFTELPREINEDGDLVISWLFQADIMTKFDYSRYPLEVEYLDLQITSASAKNNILLVPDVASYKFGSNRTSGLREDIFASGWEVFRAYFTLKTPEKTQPTFGMKQDFDKKPFNELHFKIGLKRIIVDAFIANLTPLIVVAIILFSVALLPNSIDISRVLGICVSVFFVVVFAHLAIRRNIATGEIFYLEYFFFTIYLALLLVPVDAFRETLGIRSNLFEYKNGLVYKVMYWPSLLGIFYTVTVLKFI